jgi:hypothetical protein
MIYVQDNFLPQDQFLALKERANKRFTKSNGSQLRPGDEPVRITHHGVDGNWQEGCRLLGYETIPAALEILNTFKKLNIKSLDNWSVWFQYLGADMDIPIHCDQALRYSTQKNCYTTALYLTDWEKGMGGEFVAGDPVYEDQGYKGYICVDLVEPLTIVEPLPNRLLIWSRDIWHKVNKVTTSDPNYKRTFFGTGWSSINDGTKWKNVH